MFSTGAAAVFTMLVLVFLSSSIPLLVFFLNKRRLRVVSVRRPTFMVLIYFTVVVAVLGLGIKNILCE